MLAGSPYAGGVFFLDIVFPHEYPFKPPKVRVSGVGVQEQGKVLADSRSGILHDLRAGSKLCSGLQSQRPSMEGPPPLPSSGFHYEDTKGQC